jgi:hypothetical protein
MKHELVPIKKLEIITKDGQKLIPIKPLCQMLGIDFKSQYEKLKADKILSSTVVLSTTVGGDGKDREMVCIPFKFAFMWLSKISAHNVNENARHGLITAQMKAYDLLWDSLISYQKYVEYRNHSIEEQIAVRDAYRIDFNQAKDRLTESERELKARLAVSFQNYIETHTQLEIEFIEGSEVA